jgi:hypothetical protein
MSAACFQRSQIAGDNQVTFSVTVLSPAVLYYWLVPGSRKCNPMSTRPLRSDAMNDKTGGTRGPRRAGALAAMAAVAVLATACGTSSDPSTDISASGGPATVARLDALARCMRGHGAPTFPDPGTSGGFNLTTTPNGPSGAIDIDSRQIQAAYRACRHLLADGGPNLSQLQRRIRQREQQALPRLAEFARCMRGHGVPDFPDPTPSGLDLKNAGISPMSPQFQAALRACQHALPAGAHITVSTRINASGT